MPKKDTQKGKKGPVKGKKDPKKEEKVKEVNQNLDVLICILNGVRELSQNTKFLCTFLICVFVLSGVGIWIDLWATYWAAGGQVEPKAGSHSTILSLCVLIPSIVGPLFFDLFDQLKNETYLKEHIVYGLMLFAIVLLIASGILIWRKGTDSFFAILFYILSLVCWVSVNAGSPRFVKIPTVKSLLPPASDSNQKKEAQKVAFRKGEQTINL